MEGKYEKNMILLAVFLLICYGCNKKAPSGPENTAVGEMTATVTMTRTIIQTGTMTETATASQTPTMTVTLTGTITITETSSATCTGTVSETATETATATCTVTPTSLVCGGNLIGNMAVSYNWASNCMLISSYTLASDITFNYVMFGVGNEAGNIGKQYRIGIYADNTGSPGALISETSGVAMTYNSFNAFVFPLTTLNAGTYWIGTVAEGSILISDGNGLYACGSAWSDFSAGLPASGTYATNPIATSISAYFVYCE